VREFSVTVSLNQVVVRDTVVLERIRIYELS